MGVREPVYDVAALRADFPILALPVYGKPLVYLDNAASAQKPRAVLERVQRAYTQEYSNVHRGLHYLANAATEGYEGARDRLARFLNAGRREEIVFTRSATEAINLVAGIVERAGVKPGDEIVLSILEHHANIVPWHFLRERYGAALKWIPCDARGELDLDAFDRLLSERTRMVAVTQMSNVLGTVTPVAEIVRRAHAAGAPVLVDGSQGAVHRPVDVQALGCDYYVVTGHKLYGPTGVGALYGRYDLLAKAAPFLGGGEMIREVTCDAVSYGQPPHRFEAGTPPIVQAIGLGAALDYIETVGRDAIAAHEGALTVYAHERLASVPGLRLLGEARDKGGVVSFVMDCAHAHDIATLIDRSGVAVRAGRHCAMPLLQRFGVASTCRASFALYNTFAEVDALVAALTRAAALFG